MSFVLLGEPGTGKSSLLVALYGALLITALAICGWSARSTKSTSSLAVCAHLADKKACRGRMSTATHGCLSKWRAETRLSPLRCRIVP